VTSDPANLAPEAREHEIERLAQELGRLIQGADPERRHDLSELAIALMREEFIHKVEPAPDAATPAPFNPLGTGVLLFFLGGGLSFVFGSVGLLLKLGGVTFVVWGALISWLRKAK